MIRSFRALVALAVVSPAVAVAQYPAYPVAQSCPGGVCPRVQAAVTGVRHAAADLIYHTGNVVHGPAVPGVYADGTVCQPPAVASVPRRMPGVLTAAHSTFMAATGRFVHSGRFVPGATKEGIGFSSVSAQDAIRHCCYWGQAQPVSIGVRRGIGGWYATVQYR